MNHSAYQSKLNAVGNALAQISAKTAALLRQAGGLPDVSASKQKAAGYSVNRAGYVGVSRRLSDAERERALSLLDAGHSVQAVASELRTSRPTIYALSHSRRPGLHNRNSLAGGGGS